MGEPLHKSDNISTPAILIRCLSWLLCAAGTDSDFAAFSSCHQRVGFSRLFERKAVRHDLLRMEIPAH